VVLEEIPRIGGHRTDPEMGIIAEGKIVISVVEGDGTEIPMVGDPHQEQEHPENTQDDHREVFLGQVNFSHTLQFVFFFISHRSGVNLWTTSNRGLSFAASSAKI